MEDIIIYPQMKLRVFLLSDRAKIASPALGDAGYDLFTPTDVELPALSDSVKPTKIPMGVAVAIPKGHAGLIWDKSSIGAMGIKVFGGLIDSSYRGEIHVVIQNMSAEPIKVLAGTKLTQMIIVPVATPEIDFVNRIESLGETERGSGGFGSTGST